MCVTMAMISTKTASIYTQELKRTPPAKKSGVELTESEILDREQKLAAYRKKLGRPISGKHIQAYKDVKATRVAAEGAKTAAEGAQAAAEEGTAASKDALREFRDFKDTWADKLGELQRDFEDKGAKIDELHARSMGVEVFDQRDDQTNKQRLSELERQKAEVTQLWREAKKKVSEDREKKAEQRQKEKEERQRLAREKKARAAEAKKKAKPEPNQQRRGKRKAPASPTVEEETANPGLAHACGAAASSRQRHESQPGDGAVLAPRDNLLRRYPQSPDCAGGDEGAR